MTATDLKQLWVASDAYETPKLHLFFDADPDRLRAHVGAQCTATRCDWSSSYHRGYAVLAGYDGRVGVDIAPAIPIDGRGIERLSDEVLTPDEQIGIAWTDPLRRGATLMNWWSAKVALARALGNACARVPTRLDSPARWPGWRAGPWRCARLDLGALAGESALGAPEGLVGWVVFELGDEALGR